MSQSRTIKTRNLIAYGMGDLYGGGSFFLISTFAMYYLITVVGLSPLLAALVPGLGKVWDAISDPLMGYITDHTKSRFGRRRIYFLIGIIPIIVTFTLIWIPVSFNNQIFTFLYYFIAYLFFYTVITMVMTPYSALSAEMTQNFKERNKLTGTRMIFSLLATLARGVLAQPIIEAFPEPSQGHMVMGLVFSLLFAIPWLFVFLGTWELPVSEQSVSDVNVLQNFKSIFLNRSFLIHIAMYICSYGALDILMGWFKFYMVDYLNAQNFIVFGLGAILICEVIGLPFYVSYANKRGHARAYMIGLIIWAVGMVLLVFHQPFDVNASAGLYPQFLLLIANCMLVGFGSSAGIVIPWTVLPFTTDVDEIITKQKRAGIYSGAMTLLRKLIQGALVIPLLGLMLTVIDYQEPSRYHVILTQSTGKIIQNAKSLIRTTDYHSMRDTRDQLARNISRFERAFMDMGENTNRESILRSIASIKILNSEIKEENTIENNRAQAELIAQTGEGILNDLRIQQAPESINMLRILFIIAPLVLISLGIIFSLKFKINPFTHSILMEEIERLKAGGKKEKVTPEVKRVCEELTGRRYDDLYK